MCVRVKLATETQDSTRHLRGAQGKREGERESARLANKVRREFVWSMLCCGKPTHTHM